MVGIEISHLKVSFTLEQKKLDVLNDINLFIPQNKITVILGKSGCGKTTFLRVIKGLEKNYQGKINYHHLKMAYVFQEPRLMPWLTVYQNIIFGLSKKDIYDIQPLIKLVGLEGFAKAYPHQLSGGMKSRVAIARALAYKADFILMDEPFSALDYFTRLNMQKELLHIYEHHHLGILFVTHSIDEALMLGHNLLIMGKGKIIAEYKIDDVKRDLLADKYILLKKQIINNLGGKNE